MFADIAAPIVSLLNSLMEPLLLIVGALGSLYCVILGVKYAKAEEPQDREKAKGSLKNAVVGFVLIFVLNDGPSFAGIVGEGSRGARCRSRGTVRSGYGCLRCCPVVVGHRTY